MFLTRAFTLEWVTGIEPALSAWEDDQDTLMAQLTCGFECPWRTAGSW
ncbi:MAG: hypothetical protein QG597_2643 [Actinomycetota bacterium]|nr:hypothetical protein [Actinomycetota bacterium]